MHSLCKQINLLKRKRNKNKKPRMRSIREISAKKEKAHKGKWKVK